MLALCQTQENSVIGNVVTAWLYLEKQLKADIGAGLSTWSLAFWSRWECFVCGPMCAVFEWLHLLQRFRWYPGACRLHLETPGVLCVSPPRPSASCFRKPLRGHLRTRAWRHACWTSSTALPSLCSSTQPGGCLSVINWPTPLKLPSR